MNGFNINRTLRLKNWWIPIVPPVLSFAYLGILFSGRHPSEIYIGLLSLFFLTLGTAATGFIINDWSDIASDALCGKKNGMAPVKPPVRFILLFLSLLVSIISVIVTKNYFIAGLYLIQIFLFFIYSCHPFRLKRFPLPAIILDSLYSGTIFWVIAFSIWQFYPLPASLVAITGLLKGLRNIIFHQHTEIELDRKLPFRTFVICTKERHIRLLINLCFLLEIFALFFWFFFSLKIGIIISSALLLWVLFLFFKKIKFLKRTESFPYFTLDITESDKSNALYEELLPVLTIASLCLADPHYLILMAVHLLLFGKFEVLKKLSHVIIIHFLYHKVLVYLYYKLFCNRHIKKVYRFLGFNVTDGK